MCDGKTSIHNVLYKPTLDICFNILGHSVTILYHNTNKQDDWFLQYLATSFIFTSTMSAECIEKQHDQNKQLIFNPNWSKYL